MFAQTFAKLRIIRDRAAQKRSYIRPLDLDEHMLRDIGVTRDDISRALRRRRGAASRSG